VKRLLDRGALVDAVDVDGDSPLITAAENGQLSYCGASVDLVKNKGCTALMAASWKGHVDVVAALLEEGADVNHRLRLGRLLFIPRLQCLRDRLWKRKCRGCLSAPRARCECEWPGSEWVLCSPHRV
jgi:hypothetical protein